MAQIEEINNKSDIKVVFIVILIRLLSLLFNYFFLKKNLSYWFNR